LCLMYPNKSLYNARSHATAHTQKMYEGRSVPGNVTPQPAPVQQEFGFTGDPIGNVEEQEEAEEEEQEEEEKNHKYDPGGMNKAFINRDMEEFHGRSLEDAVDDPMTEAEAMEQEAAEMEEMADMDLEDMVDMEP
jgi:hypothetical protein